MCLPDSNEGNSNRIVLIYSAYVFLAFQAQKQLKTLTDSWTLRVATHWCIFNRYYVGMCATFA